MVVKGFPALFCESLGSVCWALSVMCIYEVLGRACRAGLEQVVLYVSPHVEGVEEERRINPDEEPNLNSIPRILFNHVFLIGYS